MSQTPDIVERLRKGALLAVDITPAMTIIMPDGKELKCEMTRISKTHEWRYCLQRSR